MCGLVGYVNYTKDISSSINIIKSMNTTIEKRGPDDEGYYIEKHVLLGHKRLSIIDIEGGIQPISVKYNENIYTIIYNGQLYNTEELRKELQELGMNFNSYSDTEVLLKSFIYWGSDVVNKLNGIFSFVIWDKKKEEIFMARDHFGVKPLYYTNCNNNFIFASEIKAILAHPDVETVVDSQGMHELIGLGPCHTPGFTYFKNILEVKPAHYLIFNKSGIHMNKYWYLKTKKHIDSFETTCDTIKYLLEDSIKRQLVSDVPLCTMLSGGIDSSIISTYASNHFKKLNLPNLNTYSITYVDNDKNFVKSDFQPNTDEYYIDVMKNFIGSQHKSIVLDTEDLANYLREAVIARDYPGMADIDSSLLLFCKEIKKDMKVAISGECADEVFGGYPWFFRQDSLDSNTFPWSIAINEREKLLNQDIFYNFNLRGYIDSRYNESLEEVDYGEIENIVDLDKLKNNSENKKKDIFHLNLYWFMQTLLERSDKMGMYNGLEIRVPFCDYRLVQYVWNIPWEMKALNGREKGLLRHIAKDILPSEIVERKKSPYPKTHNPTYLAKIKEMLGKTLADTNAPINNLLSRAHLQEILNTEGKAFTRPWFGQLMTGPQLMAYLYQFNEWLEIYKPRIEL